jgi:hypothetical protein
MDMLSSAVPVELIKAMKVENDEIRELASRTMIQFGLLKDGRAFLVS